MTERITVLKLTLCVIDFDEFGAEEWSAILENSRYPNHAIPPDVMEVEEREIEWPEDDSHPLNFAETAGKAFRDLFTASPKEQP